MRRPSWLSLRTLFVSPIIAESIPPGTVLAFAIVVSAADESPVEKSATTNEGERNLAVEVREDANRTKAGDEVPFTLSYANLSDVKLENVVILFIVPPSSTFLAASDGGTLNSEGAVEWILGDLEPRQGGALQVIVLSDQALPAGAQLEAKAEASTDDARSLATTHTAFADSPLQASVKLTPTQPEPDEQVRVLATTSNRTLATQEDVSISIRVPPGVQSLPLSSLSPGGTCPGDLCEVGELVQWELGELEPAESHTVSLVAIVLPNTEGTFIPFDARVSAGGVLVISGRATAVPGERTLELRLDESDNPVRPGDELTYSVQLANQSASPVDSTVAVRIPKGSGFVDASDDGGFADGAVSWPMTQLLPGKGVARRLRVVVDPSVELGAQLRADATATIAGAAANALATAYTPVGVAALRATVGLTPNPVKTNEKAATAVTVSNPSSEAATNVVIDIRVPPHVNSVSPAQLSSGGSCPDDSCDPGEIVSWMVGTLDPGRSTTVSFRRSFSRAPQTEP